MRRIVGRIGLAAGIALAALASRLVRYEIAEDSMEPTLSDGDWVLAVRSLRGPRVGDVVVLDHPERPGFELVKRVTAVAGDRVGDIHLLPGEVWVEGDDPVAGSVDSRRFGPVLAGSVQARVVLRYRPLPPTVVR
ncbi:MAG: S26 family signal peptidase [Acidimicrobiia bacterium]|nr:S26 family signal peptidase [Acidimicrobiia bacterium]